MAGILAMTAVTAPRLAGPLILRKVIDKAIPARVLRLTLGYAVLYLGLIIVMGVPSYFQTILKADKILFIKEGRIIAQGRHEELLANLPEYGELVRLQFPDLAMEAVR